MKHSFIFLVGGSQPADLFLGFDGFGVIYGQSFSWQLFLISGHFIRRGGEGVFLSLLSLFFQRNNEVDVFLRFFFTTNDAPPMSKIYSDVFFGGFFFNMLVWEG